jgi:hypothetical protein
MSRDITSGFQTGITAAVLTPIILIEGYFDSGTMYLWSGVGDLSYGGNTYVGAAGILGVTDVVETSKIEARGASFTMQGIPTSYLSLALSENYQDRAVVQRLALLDSAGAIISNPYTFFSGKMDVMTIADGGESATITVTAENDLIALKRANERRRTPEDQKLTYAGDTFFDQVARLQELDITWGGG